MNERFARKRAIERRAIRGDISTDALRSALVVRSAADPMGCDDFDDHITVCTLPPLPVSHRTGEVPVICIRCGRNISE